MVSSPEPEIVEDLDVTFGLVMTSPLAEHPAAYQRQTRYVSLAVVCSEKATYKYEISKVSLYSINFVISSGTIEQHSVCLLFLQDCSSPPLVKSRSSWRPCTLPSLSSSEKEIRKKQTTGAHIAVSSTRHSMSLQNIDRRNEKYYFYFVNRFVSVYGRRFFISINVELDDFQKNFISVIVL